MKNNSFPLPDIMIQCSTVHQIAVENNRHCKTRGTRKQQNLEIHKKQEIKGVCFNMKLKKLQSTYIEITFVSDVRFNN